MTPPIVVAPDRDGLQPAGPVASPSGTPGGVWMILTGFGLHAAGHFTRESGWAGRLSQRVVHLCWQSREPGDLGLRNAHFAMALTFWPRTSRRRGWLLLVEETARVNPEPFLQLDRVIHEGQLAMMAALAATPELSFTELARPSPNDGR